MTQLKDAPLRRPRLLVRAARMGLKNYSRTRDLKRIMQVSILPRPPHALANLHLVENEQEEKRLSGQRTYSPARHVEILIALMAEQSFIETTATPRSDK